MAHGERWVERALICVLSCCKWFFGNFIGCLVVPLDPYIRSFIWCESFWSPLRNEEIKNYPGTPFWSDHLYKFAELHTFPDMNEEIWSDICCLNFRCIYWHYIAIPFLVSWKIFYIIFKSSWIQVNLSLWTPRTITMYTTQVQMRGYITMFANTQNYFI